MTTLSAQAASYRAAFKQELVRLEARSWQFGPFIAYREGVWIASPGDVVLTDEHLARLRALPDGAGAEAVWRVLSPAEAMGPLAYEEPTPRDASAGVRMFSSGAAVSPGEDGGGGPNT